MTLQWRTYGKVESSKMANQINLQAPQYGNLETTLYSIFPKEYQSKSGQSLHGHAGSGYLIRLSRSEWRVTNFEGGFHYNQTGFHAEFPKLFVFSFPNPKLSGLSGHRTKELARIQLI